LFFEYNRLCGVGIFKAIHLPEADVKSLLVRLVIQSAFAATAVAALITFRHASLGVLAVVILTYLSVLILVIAIMLNYPRLPRQAMVNDFADELEARNLLVSTLVHADRAFRVDECEEEGPHYFLELEEGGILHLSGKYLYEYEPIEGSLRLFPCTQFTLQRHAERGYVVNLICSGLVIEPEVEAPAYSADDFAQHRVPADQAILRDISFDQLLLERTTPRASLP
jgi:hypothetical protein